MDRQFLTEALDQNRVFEMTYRRIKGGDPFYVRMKVSRMEDDNRCIVIGVTDIDEQVKQRRAEEKMKEERASYGRIHALTGNVMAVYMVDPETDSYREFGSADDYREHFGQLKEGESFFDTAREAVRVHGFRRMWISSFQPSQKRTYWRRSWMRPKGCVCRSICILRKQNCR